MGRATVESGLDVSPRLSTSGRRTKSSRLALMRNQIKKKKVLMPEGKKNEAEEDQGQGPVAAVKLPDQKGPV